MEPRQGGRFHIWHMLTREMPFCNLCASKDGTFERDENCAPKRPARFPASISHPRYLQRPETITRPFLTAARLDIPAVPGWSRIGRYTDKKYVTRDTVQVHTTRHKNPGRKGPGLLINGDQTNG